MFSFVAEHMQKLVAMGAAVTGVVVCLPQTIFLERYKNVVHVYEKGEKASLDEETVELTDMVLDRYNMPPSLAGNIDFFPVYGFDIIHRGTVQMKTGSIIGIPANLSYKTESDVDTGKILVRNEPVDWNSGAGKDLRDSLILSPNGKLFGVAREICYVSRNHVAIQGAATGLACFTAYWIGFALNNLYSLRTRMKMWGRFGLYGVIGVSVYYLHLFCMDAILVRRDLKTDKNVSKLGVEYAEGGLEYYEKLLQRNKALRQLMGAAGEKAYTMYGNKMVTLREGGAPITVRRDRMVENLKQYKSREEKEEIAS